MTQNNKHYKVEKQNDSWDVDSWNFVERDPGEYEGKHRGYDMVDLSNKPYSHESVTKIYMGCKLCIDKLTSPAGQDF